MEIKENSGSKCHCANEKLKKIKKNAADHYSKKINEHGPSFQGVDWGSSLGQIIRFQQLTKMLPFTPATTLIDFGCGYGALAEYLHDAGFQGEYQGYDISAAMIEQAERLHGDRPRTTFTTTIETLVPCDFALASGVFNVKMDTSEDDWLSYIFCTMDQVRDLSRKGFVFNLLSNKTAEIMCESDLYYADPDFMREYCRQRFNADVLLWDDYPLNDFTVFVRLDPNMVHT
jgi:SAM-dependent methyltransferase